MPLTKIDTGAIKDDAINSAKIADGTVVASDVLDNTITGAKLASDIAISTSGNITTTGAFTSTGIDDNATSTAITINSNENVLIGDTTEADARRGKLKVRNDVDYSLTEFEDDATILVQNETNNNSASIVFHSNNSAGSSFRSAIIGGVIRDSSNALGFYGNVGNLTTSTEPDVIINSSGNVGIGTSSPQEQVDISSATPTIRFSDTSVTNLRHLIRSEGNDLEISCDVGNVQADSHIGFKIDNSERMRITSTGNVGIGTSSPSAPLDIQFADATAYSATANNPSLEIGNINSSANTNFSSISMFTDGNGRGIVNLNALNNATAASADFSIQTRDSGTLGERLRVTKSGNVGIGTSSPDSTAKLHTSTSNATARTITETTNAAGYAGYRATNGTGYWEMQVDGSNQGLRWLDDGSERMRIDSSGNVGIGTSSPTNNLDIVDSAIGDIGINITNTISSPGGHSASVNLISENANSDLSDATKGAIFVGGDLNGNNFQEFAIATESNTPIVFVTNGDGVRSNGVLTNERMRIESNGLVRIKNTSHTNSLITNNHNLVIGNESSGAHGLAILSPTNENGYISFFDSGNSGSLRGTLNYNHSDDSLRTYVNGSERMRIDSSGKVLIGTTSGGSFSGQAVVAIGNSIGIINNRNDSVATGGTLDITVNPGGGGYQGFLCVSNTRASSAVFRTHRTYSVFGRGTDSSIQQIAADNGTGGGATFTVTTPSNGVIRVTNTSGATCAIFMQFFGGFSF